MQKEPAKAYLKLLSHELGPPTNIHNRIIISRAQIHELSRGSNAMGLGLSIYY